MVDLLEHGMHESELESILLQLTLKVERQKKA